MQCGESVPCSVVPFTLRSLAVESGRAERAKQQRQSEQAREGGTEVCHSLDYNQYVWETVTAATLQGTALQLNSKNRQKVETLAVRVQLFATGKRWQLLD